MSIVLAVILFGTLICLHEAGHYCTARLFKVGINEFSIGMGPKLISKKSKKTDIVYSLRLLPIGGYVSMVGEDDSSDRDDALYKKPVWQRIIIDAAGSIMNILTGIIIVFIIVLCTKNLASTTIAAFPETSTLDEQGFEIGDKIVKIGNTRVYSARDLSEKVMFKGLEKTDVSVIRDGKETVLRNIEFTVASAEGISFAKLDCYVAAEEKNFGNIIKQTYGYAKSSVDMIWQSLIYLVKGKVGLDQMSGPIGVTGAIDDVAKTGGASGVADLCALIALNLGIFNLLPFPALDGGRLVFLVIELVTGKPVKREIEGYIHFAGLVLLMMLMVIITYKDIMNLF